MRDLLISAKKSCQSAFLRLNVGLAKKVRRFLGIKDGEEITNMKVVNHFPC